PQPRRRRPERRAERPGAAGDAATVGRPGRAGDACRPEERQRRRAARALASKSLLPEGVAEMRGDEPRCPALRISAVSAVDFLVSRKGLVRRFAPPSPPPRGGGEGTHR